MTAAFGVLISVQETKGSAPREAGTCMWVDARGTQGTIGGGNLEFHAIEQAHKLLADDSLTEITQTYALGPLLEQCCGGSVVLHLGKHAQAERQALMADHRPLAPLYMFGAGHVGKAVMQAIHRLPFTVTWVDERADEFPSMLPKTARKITDRNPVRLVESASPDSLFLIFTHSHQLDYEITAAVLARGDARYCGLIGSKTKRARFESRLLKDGSVSEDALAGLTCPIGVEGIAGKEPEVIAAAVAAQLLQQI